MTRIFLSVIQPKAEETGEEEVSKMSSLLINSDIIERQSGEEGCREGYNQGGL